MLNSKRIMTDDCSGVIKMEGRGGAIIHIQVFLLVVYKKGKPVSA